MDQDKIARVVKDLEADWQRQGNVLQIADAERLIDGRKLTAEEGLEAWRLLQVAGILPATDPQRGFLSRFAPKARARTLSEIDLIRIYLQAVGQVRLLNAEDEIELGRRIHLGQQAQLKAEEMSGTVSDESELTDELRQVIERAHEAWEVLVVSNLRLVISIAKTYSKGSSHLGLMDIIQNGNIGLFRAADKFDYRMGFKFSTYATWWIRQSIQRESSNTGRAIRLPVHVSFELGQISRVQQRLNGELGRAPSIQEIADRSDIPIEKIRFLLDIAQEPLSLDAPLEAESDDDSYTVTDVREDEDSIFGDPINSILVDDLVYRVRNTLHLLNEREREVLVRRFGLDGLPEETLEDIGQRLGCTRENIRLIQKRAILKLKIDHYELRSLIDD